MLGVTLERVTDLDDHAHVRRVKFYGANDLNVGLVAPRAVEVLETFDTSAPLASAADALEVVNAIKFVEAKLLPTSLSEEALSALAGRVPALREAVARFFRSVEESNAALVLADIPIFYRDDLLAELARQGAFERCGAASMLSALQAAGFVLGDFLESKALVKAYDVDIRSMMMSDPANAHILVQKHLMAGSRPAIHLPASFTSTDARDLMGRYVECDEAHPNSLELIARSSDDAKIGIDRRVRFQARKRRNEVVAKFFETNNGLETGCEVRVDDLQSIPAIEALDGMVAKYSYSRGWLEGTLDPASVLNNFQFLFDFADADGLLNLPSFYADLGVFDRFLTSKGVKDYAAGAAYRLKDWSSTLQTALYIQFLKSHDVELESLLEWFVDDYLPTEFGVAGFRFKASSPSSSYLERCRHLFPEMEGLVRQFGLFVEDGFIDFDMLGMSSEAVAYTDVPSALRGKYAYRVDGTDLVGILNALFSDQSWLTYIRDDLQDINFARLVVKNRLQMNDFAEHQLPGVTYLVDHGVLADRDGCLVLANNERFLILHTLWTKEAVNYHQLSEAGRTYVDEMEGRGWVTRKATLFTDAEGSYFDFLLNRKFHNGPNLRNKYSHGAQPEGGEDAHFASYVVAIKLLVALVIKLNDEFCLSDAGKRGPTPVADESAA